METKKIEGFTEKDDFKINGRGDRSIRLFQDREAGDYEATLVIFPGEREKVYTESEVRVMLDDMKQKLETMRAFAQEHYRAGYADTTCAGFRAFEVHLNNIAAMHGIKLT